MPNEELIAALEKATAEDVFDWTALPSWASYGAEHFDGHWTPDCNGKLDYDPGLMRLSCRVYRGGTYMCSVYFGGDYQIEDSGVLKAESVEEARKAVEAWCVERAHYWRGVVIAALRATERGEAGR